jgi:hypothetical protein
MFSVTKSEILVAALGVELPGVGEDFGIVIGCGNTEQYPIALADVSPTQLRILAAHPRQQGSRGLPPQPLLDQGVALFIATPRQLFHSRSLQNGVQQ